jgi:hypothetical protein
MSFGTIGRMLRCLAAAAVVGLTVPSWSWAQACASCGTCNTQPYCQTHHCPPAFHHCQEGPPHLCFKCGCPHPVCNPCDLPHWGYFETCWAPFPVQWLDWTHCPTPPPAAFVTLDPLAGRGQNVPALTVPNPQPQRVPSVLPPPGPYGGNPTLPQPRSQSGL